jgi:hypothetical protein
VIDGAIRDVAAFAASDFPCFARTAIHRGPYKSGPGEINVPVSIGGSVISPGDIVVGDEDGVVSFPAATAATLLGGRSRPDRARGGKPSSRSAKAATRAATANPDRCAKAPRKTSKKNEGKRQGRNDESRRTNFTISDNPADGLFRELASGVTTRIFSGEHAMLSVVTLAPHAQGTLHHHPRNNGACCSMARPSGSGR